MSAFGNRLSDSASLESRHFESLPLLLHFARGYHQLESEFEFASPHPVSNPPIGPKSNIHACSSGLFFRKRCKGRWKRKRKFNREQSIEAYQARFQ
jgi:hypothetical protein